MKLKIIILLLFLSSLLHAQIIKIDEMTKSTDILSHSEIYIDKTKNLTIDDIIGKNLKFEPNSKKILPYGYSPDFNVWIKFTLQNNSNSILNRIIEYDNPLTTTVNFYDPDKNYQEQKNGLFSKDFTRNSVNPTFEAHLKANETKTYYLNVSSYITTLIIKVKLWQEEAFFNKEVFHQIILALFFGSMLILGVYNLFIFFFTKDLSYLYYVLYIFGIVFHQLVYVGFIKFFIESTQTIHNLIEAASIIVAFPVLALGMFTKTFLQTKQYPKHNLILNAFLILIPIAILFFLFSNGYDKYRNLFTMLLLIYLMYLTLYAAIKRNRQAYFILFAWTIFLTSGMLMFLSSAGIFNIYEHVPYFVEISFILEAILFSIALANRINSLQKEKEEANKKLLDQQKNETKILAKKVEERTVDLTKALEEKSLLLKELNHRVKNNMQTIVSLIRLQNDEVEDERLQDVLMTIQNRINAMSHLHELLYRKDDISSINAFEYFEVLVEEVKYSYQKDIEIILNVKTELRIEDAIYCGLILNELLTNSFKYAFPKKEGNIYINLEKNDNTFLLEVKDNGIGYDKKSIKDNSLGTLLIHTLATQQLDGEIVTDSQDGVKVSITWIDYEKGKDFNS
ncbi:7TM diverse intracellular signaling domain-containing protein [Halarcobacter ebronensis]|nr:7TM diverse intracellular signaling domain-containing protein [Halarcobacter ebronensis]QKF83251.1 7TMR-DISM-7TM/7TMR-DISMED2 domain-containing two-component system sensor histidine kinase [Halarcobacter ebronensis]